MKAPRYTQEQLGAIEENRRDILVSASAGSGKTTVMLERVCRLLRGGAQLGGMVICTFTNASAADMRRKLTTKLAALAQSEAWAAAALGEMPLAEITTIDSFCARLCRNYFYYTDLDPMFEVLDQAEAGAYLAASMDEVFLKSFESGDAGFVQLSAIFSQSRSDRKLQQLIMRLMNFSSIQPAPDVWLDSVFLQAGKHREHLEAIAAWDDGVFDKADALAARDPIDTLPHLEALVGLTRAVREAYAVKKHKKGALDFNDVEHAALAILSSSEGGAAVRERFRYLFVDEFQDVNPLQEAIFSALTEDAATGAQTADRFYVGDVKQSIYRFRLSDPAIFMRKRQEVTERYGMEGERSGAKPFLFPHNFRSEKRILNFCDSVFSGLMTTEFGGADYENERFKPGAGVSFCAPVVCNMVRPDCADAEEYPTVFKKRENVEKLPRPVYSVQQHPFDDDAEIGLQEAQINWIAQHILDLKQQIIEEPVGGETIARRVCYRDIVVLTRSGGSFTERLLQKLDDTGIPAWIEKDIEPNQNPAVRSLIAYLNLVRNRRDDVALAVALKSAPGGFCTDSDLAQIRLYADQSGKSLDTPFWKACADYRQNGTDERLKETLTKLDEGLTRYETLSQAYGFAELAGIIAVECDAFQYALAYPNGDKVADGLAQFLDGLTEDLTLEEGLLAVESGAITLTAPRESDAVRIMTIHASKGLEFPFVILANLEKRYNTEDLRQDCILDTDWGAALKFFAESEGKIYKTSLWYRAAREILKKQLEEELRILYVGLTRGIYQTALFASVPCSYQPKRGLNVVCALDFLYDCMLPIAAVRPPNDCSAPPVSVPIKPVYSAPNPDTVRAFRAYTDFVYPYAAVPAKTTVTRLSRASLCGEEGVNYAGCAAAQAEEGMRVGDAYHKFLETYDYKTEFGANFATFQAAYPDYAKLISVRQARGAVTKLGMRIAGRKIYRELPFLYNDNGTFVQGIIDLLIERGDGVEIIDYKTGKISSSQLDAYQTQLDLYARAVENTLKKRVLAKSVLSLHTAEFLDL